MPKYHWLPVLLWCNAGARSPEAFAVELGALISVASTTVPARSVNPLSRTMSLTTARIQEFSFAPALRRKVQSKVSLLHALHAR